MKTTITIENEKHYIANYLIIGTPGDYRVMEQFDGYRMLKKVFRTVEEATLRINKMVEIDELK